MPPIGFNLHLCLFNCHLSVCLSEQLRFSLLHYNERISRLSFGMNNSDNSWVESISVIDSTLSLTSDQFRWPVAMSYIKRPTVDYSKDSRHAPTDFPMSATTYCCQPTAVDLALINKCGLATETLFRAGTLWSGSVRRSSALIRQVPWLNIADEQNEPTDRNYLTGDSFCYPSS